MSGRVSRQPSDGRSPQRRPVTDRRGPIRGRVGGLQAPLARDHSAGGGSASPAELWDRRHSDFEERRDCPGTFLPAGAGSRALLRLDAARTRACHARPMRSIEALAQAAAIRQRPRGAPSGGGGQRFTGFRPDCAGHRPRGAASAPTPDKRADADSAQEALVHVLVCLVTGTGGRFQARPVEYSDVPAAVGNQVPAL